LRFSAFVMWLAVANWSRWDFGVFRLLQCSLQFCRLIQLGFGYMKGFPTDRLPAEVTTTTSVLLYRESVQYSYHLYMYFTGCTWAILLPWPSVFRPSDRTPVTLPCSSTETISTNTCWLPTYTAIYWLSRAYNLLQG
jgi:hypothetical protein